MGGPWSSRHWPWCWLSEWPLMRGSLRPRTWAVAAVSAEALALVVVLGLVEEVAPVVDLVEGSGTVEVLAAGLEVE